MADFNNPDNNGSLLSQFGHIRDLFTSAVRWFDGTSDSNIPVGAKRFVEGTKAIEEYNGSTWDHKGYLNDTANAGAAAATAQAAADAAQAAADTAQTTADDAQTAADEAASSSGVTVVYVGPSNTGDGSGKDASNVTSGASVYTKIFAPNLTNDGSEQDVLSGKNYEFRIMSNLLFAQRIQLPPEIVNCNMSFFSHETSGTPQLAIGPAPSESFVIFTNCNVVFSGIGNTGLSAVNYEDSSTGGSLVFRGSSVSSVNAQIYLIDQGLEVSHSKTNVRAFINGAKSNAFRFMGSTHMTNHTPAGDNKIMCGTLSVDGGSFLGSLRADFAGIQFDVGSGFVVRGHSVIHYDTYVDASPTLSDGGAAFS